MSTTEQQILDLARSGQIAMCLIDLPGHIYQANAAFLDLVGATQEDVQTGLSLHEFLNLPQRSPRDEQEPHELQVSQWTATFEQELLRRDGSRLPVLVEFSWLENASDQYIAKIVELVKYQALHAAAIIESSDDAIIGKDLNGIIGFSELIYDEKVGPLSEEQKEYLGDTLSSAKHLLRLITD